MKIQCDVCEKAPATLICCADEAALCANCDVAVHAANKLASKHQRLLLESLPNKFPRCDICQEKPAFIFCVEDRALFCRDCDEPIHVSGSLSGDHQRYLATGIRVGLNPVCAKDSVGDNNSEPPKSYAPNVEPKFSPVPQVASPFVPSWPVDDFLQLSDYESNDKYQKGSPLGFGELDWFSDIGLLQEQQTPTKGSRATAEVPELRVPHSHNNNSMASFYKPHKSGVTFKKPRIETSDDEEFFVVPDLG